MRSFTDSGILILVHASPSARKTWHAHTLRIRHSLVLYIHTSIREKAIIRFQGND